MRTVSEITSELVALVGMQSAAPQAVALGGREPGLPSSFRVGAAAQATFAAVGIAAAQRLRRRTGISQTVLADMEHAVAAFQSERFLSLNGQRVKGFRDPLAGVYRCRNDGWFRPHITFPHHKTALLQVLGLRPDVERDGLAAEIGQWNSVALEEAVYRSNGVGAALRTAAEWDDHPQSAAVAADPLIRLTRIADAPARDVRSQRDLPLDRVRVLDLTRVIAGPVCGRALAAYGAEVLAVSSDRLPAIEQLVLDTNRGKRSANIDLETAEGASILRRLVHTVDIFLQSYRPGSLAARGFGPADLAKLRPGLIYVQLSAFGDKGPWANRRGFDSLVQTATGFNAEEMAAARSDTPMELPCQILDHASGQLMALGAIAALEHRAREGGSWQVDVSLAATGRWLKSLGRLEDGLSFEYRGSRPEDMSPQTRSIFGSMQGVKPTPQFSKTVLPDLRPTVSLGSDPALWSDQ
ncbi:hypothetical protein WH91_18690 [Devosia psychrophila]|uniref:Carnitine dehydratase n=1 Tax=Devosia psychrophila TaxID=728005 RepID=A0ABR5DU82_9HYPH|nr:CoA transferase [Devosia psychrophila]KKC31575.1 hypothetical protein WH91_18690 [Devosia psychrophila]